MRSCFAFAGCSPEPMGLSVRSSFVANTAKVMQVQELLCAPLGFASPPRRRFSSSSSSFLFVGAMSLLSIILHFFPSE